MPLVLPGVLSAILFALPFFWLTDGASLGGDDTRLYFVYPWQWLRRFALPAFGSLYGFGAYSPQTHFIPFTALLGGVGAMFPWLNLEAFSFGIALLCGFLGVYAVSLQLLPRDGRARRSAAALAGLLFVTAPLIAVTYWVVPLTWLIGLNGAPALAALAVAYLRSGNPLWLVLLAALDAFVAIGLAALPISLPFVFGALLVAAATVLLNPGWRRRLMQRLIVLAVVLVGANTFWLLPLAVSILTPGSFGSNAMSLSSGEAAQIRGLAHGQSILDTLALLPSGEFEAFFAQPSYRLWSWYAKLLPLSMLCLGVIIGAVLVASGRPSRQSGLLVSVMVAVLLLAFLQTEHITSFGVEVFISIVSRLPGFSMFRNGYSKFAGGYSFYYCIAFALAVPSILTRFCGSLIRQRLLIALLTITIVLQGMPMLLAQTLFLPIAAPKVEGGDVTQIGTIPASYLRSMAYLARRGDDGRVLELPLSANYWSSFPLTRPASMYVGTSPVRVLSGHETFNSIESFAVSGLPELVPSLDRAVSEQDYARIAAMLRLSGIRYVVYTQPTPTETRGRWLYHPFFPADATELQRLLATLGATSVQRSDDGALTTEVFAVTPRKTLPRVYVTSQVAVAPSWDAALAGMAQGRQAVPTADRQGASGDVRRAVVTAAPGLLWSDSVDATALTTYQRASPWRYRVTVDISSPAMLVLLEPYTAGWEARFTAGAGQTGVLTKTRINGYASGWLLERPGRYMLDIVYVPQRLTWWAASVSVLTFAIVGIVALPRGRMAAGRRAMASRIRRESRSV